MRKLILKFGEVIASFVVIFKILRGNKVYQLVRSVS